MNKSEFFEAMTRRAESIPNSKAVWDITSACIRWVDTYTLAHAVETITFAMESFEGQNYTSWTQAEVEQIKETYSEALRLLKEDTYGTK